MSHGAQASGINLLMDGLIDGFLRGGRSEIWQANDGFGKIERKKKGERKEKKSRHLPPWMEVKMDAGWMDGGWRSRGNIRTPMPRFLIERLH